MFSDEWVPKNENEKNSKKTLLKKCLLILSFYSFCRVKWKEEASSNYYYIKINSLIIINCYLKNNFFIFFFLFLTSCYREVKSRKNWSEFFTLRWIVKIFRRRTTGQISLFFVKGINYVGPKSFIVCFCVFQKKNWWYSEKSLVKSSRKICEFCKSHGKIYDYFWKNTILIYKIWKISQ